MTIKAGKTEGGDALLYGTVNNPQQGSRPIGWNTMKPEAVPVLKNTLPRQTVVVGGFGTPVVNAGYNQGTFRFLRQVPFPFVGVRVGYLHMGGGGACQGIKMTGGTTEDSGTGNYATATAETLGRYCVPKRGGVSTPGFSTDGGYTGWLRATFNGALTVDAPDAGAENMSFVLSDIMPVTGAEDLAEPGWWNFIGGIHFTDATAWTSANVNGLTTGTKMREFFQGNRMLFLRTSGDDVTDPTTWGVASTPSVPTSAHLPLYFVFYGAAGQTFVTFGGDSRFATSSETTSDRYRNMTNYFSLLDRTVRSVFCSGAGWNSNQYTNQALALLRSGAFRGGVYAHLIYTVNDGAPSPAVLGRAKARAAMVAAECEAQGVIFKAIVAYPKGGGFTSSQLADLDALHDWSLTLTPLVANPLRRFGTPNGDWLPGFAFDVDHMLNTGNASAARYFYNVLKGIEI